MHIFGIGTTLGAIGDSIIGGLNYKNQQEALEWQKKQQEYVNKWNEYVYEDQKKMANTEVQRRVKDLEEAGLNKLLATGGSAGTGSAVSGSTSNIQAPQMQANLTEKIATIYDTVYNAISMSNDLAMSATQRQLMQAQMLDTMKSAGVKSNVIKQLHYDLQKSMKLGLRTNDALNGNITSAVAGSKYFLDELEDSMDKAQEAKKKVKNNIGTPRYEPSQNWRGQGGTTINGRRYGY